MGSLETEAVEWIAGKYCNINDELSMYGDYVSDGLKANTDSLVVSSRTMPTEYRIEIERFILSLIDKEKPYQTVFLYSAALAVNHSKEIFGELARYVTDTKGFGANTRYFLFCQLQTAMFMYSVQLESDSNKRLIWKLLENTVRQFERELADMLEYIPSERRDGNFALILTDQFIGLNHGPTKTALERAKTVITQLKKQVLLINTAECLSQRGGIPFYDVKRSSYLESYRQEDKIVWNGCSVPFFQCDNNMPNYRDIAVLLKLVRDRRPSLVIDIGGSGIVSNLINRMIPVLSVGLCPSDMAPTTEICQVLSRELKTEDIKLLNLFGKTEKNVIRSVFTSELRSQTEKVSREELGLPKDKFVLVSVGGRLDVEIDDAFIAMLNKIEAEDICLVLIGPFSRYEEIVRDNPKLKDKLICLGRRTDVLACLEVCDLYVNPYRKGGGTSGVEALHMGVPVLTVDYGDVAVNAGADFTVGSYDEMSEMIMKYKNDGAFCKEQSDKAKARSEVLLDGEHEFVKIINEFQKRCSENNW
ncbi:MAG: glycosyltransferase [Butyrivibrio sp.]|nr:glycosyltransferase [Butyrivibrio sp.]